MSSKVFIRRTFAASDFAGAKFYRKTAYLLKTNIREVTAEFENVGTIIGDSVETIQVARALRGDRVVVGNQGEQYVNKAADVANLWEQDPADYRRLRSKNCGWAITLEEDTEIDAPWGGVQRVAAGGKAFLRYHNREIYLIEEKAFNVYSESEQPTQ